MISKKNNKELNGGFTIVELLVVIIVIGILAAITIVSYSGITAKANLTKAQSNAQSVQNVAESFNSEKGYYPSVTADFNTAGLTTHLPTGITLLTGAQVLTTNKVPTEAWYQYCGAVAAPAANAVTGGRIQYWDPVTNGGQVSATVIYFGTGASGLGVGAGTVCNTWVTPTS